MSIVDIATHGFRRITKRQAQKLFAQGDKTVYLCPCKYYPGGPWAIACPIQGKTYLEKRGLDFAWDLMYNNWAYYNTSWELGYYAHYYVINTRPNNPPNNP